MHDWSSFHAEKVKSNYPLWPVEIMVKVLIGNYLKDRPQWNSDMRVLDIGCGFGNNLLPFYMKGMQCHGIEIAQDIIDVTKQSLLERGIDSIDLKVGHNRMIPYPDAHFDLIISNNVLHYESSENLINEAFKEYVRVLKPGGRLFLMTVGPEHDIYKKAKVLGPHSYEVQNYDFRNGEKFFFFDSLKYLESYLRAHFSTVELGHVTEKLMQHNLDFLVAVAKKG